VIDEAATIVDELGLEGLNMRLLAERCGVTTVTLYKHVQTKQHVLGELADRYLGEVELPDPSAVPWQQWLTEVFGAVRAVLLRRPMLASVAAEQRINGLSAYRAAEAVLGVLTSTGLSPEKAVSAFEALSSFTMGFVQQEIPRQDRLAQYGDRVLAVHYLPDAEFPHIKGAINAFLDRNTSTHFEAGLAMVIQGIESEIA
jgi:TetR/AcrR family transcriptional regulator, tetracycline repressor protein